MMTGTRTTDSSAKSWRRTQTAATTSSSRQDQAAVKRRTCGVSMPSIGPRGGAGWVPGATAAGAGDGVPARERLRSMARR